MGERSISLAKFVGSAPTQLAAVKIYGLSIFGFWLHCHAKGLLGISQGS